MKFAIKTQALMGERRCGDWGHHEEFENGSQVAILIDVTGHGELAALLVDKIKNLMVFEESKTVENYLDELNDICSGTVGCAAGVLIIDMNNKLHFSAMGNVLCHYFLNGVSKSFVSKDGMLGHRKGSYFTQSVKLMENDVLLLHTDGIKNLNNKRLLILEHENIDAIVHRAVRDFGKMTDDMGCLGVKI
ncbi:SpoIIE family protein phosphatase [Lentisphaera profundi]|uniref:SpoIIE family protein phosphatase n=1 Tax=Lentisphaera profundi TaxID=1658616 RepID=A0ABY7VXX1_9BACT|nr:SpoIIE family protein phosphatase [Lentisphaera profundi]WDE98065.1 SpoIIE family protein phosphatase [Lentisphaera profundi]